MEIFVFRKVGQEFTRRLRALDNVVIVYIVDGELVSSVSDLITLWFMTILIQSKFEVPVVPIINKIDKSRNVELFDIIVENPSRLKNVINSLEKELLADIASDVLLIIEKVSQSLRPVKVSALKKVGLEKLHTLLYCACGDLT